MQGLSGINTSVYQAFYKGRKAIGEHNLEEVRKQAAFIRGQMLKLFSLRTVYYLRESQTFWNGRSRCRAKVTSIPWERHLGLSWPFRL